MKKVIRFEVNEKPIELNVDENRPLLWVLRTDLGLTGTKFGCGEAHCGSCTVLLEDKPIRSCSYIVGRVNGKHIKTIEGLLNNGQLHPLQESFIKHDALQCGFCTPGMILNAYGLLIKNPKPDRNQIIKAMNGNLCRCGTYGRIIDAIQDAAQKMEGEK